MSTHGLQLRFLLVVIAGALLFALAAALVAYRVGQARALENSHATIDGLLTAVEKTAAIGAFAGDRVLLREVVEGLARSPGVGRAEARDAAGALLVQNASAPANGSAEARALGVQRRLASPFDAEEPVGQLYAEPDIGRLQAAARQEAMALAVLLAGQTALVALLLYVVAARLVSQPIVRLAEALQALPPGSSERLEVPAGHLRDEIGGLIEATNTLLGANAVALQRERELRAEIHRMEARFREIFDSTSAGIFVLDTQRRLIHVNRTLLRLLGLGADEAARVEGIDFVEAAFVHPDHVNALIETATRTGEAVVADLELRPHAPGQASRWVHCLLSFRQLGASDTASVAAVEGVVYDITERRLAESAVRHRAEHDALTGLKNRAASLEVIDRFVAQAAAEGTPCCLLFVDLDGFKQVNDVRGHKIGDQVLQECARRLRDAVRRSSDLVGRLGGDEFVIALQNMAPSDSVLGPLALELIEALRRPIEVEDGTPVRIGVSIGLATYPRHGRTRKELVQAADVAMYAVKRHGKNGAAMAWLGPTSHIADSPDFAGSQERR